MGVNNKGYSEIKENNLAQSCREANNGIEMLFDKTFKEINTLELIIKSKADIISFDPIAKIKEYLRSLEDIIINYQETIKNNLPKALQNQLEPIQTNSYCKK